MSVNAEIDAQDATRLEAEHRFCGQCGCRMKLTTLGGLFNRRTGEREGVVTGFLWECGAGFGGGHDGVLVQLEQEHQP